MKLTSSEGFTNSKVVVNNEEYLIKMETLVNK